MNEITCTCTHMHIYIYLHTYIHVQELKEKRKESERMKKFLKEEEKYVQATGDTQGLAGMLLCVYIHRYICVCVVYVCIYVYT